MFAYALTIFVGAFLLFQIQPLIGKYILPWFGGGPGIWTTCMLFFQVLLLGGYAYAHFLSRLFKPRTQAIVHFVLLGVAVALLPIIPADAWKPHSGDAPVLHILALLAACLGLPYFLLSATSPLMQQWFSRTHPGASPYRLYALSNVGSLLALLSYPFYFETHFTRQTQAALWGWGFATFVVCCGLCVWLQWRKTDSAVRAIEAQELASPETAQRPALRSRVLWLLLPACASVLLLATTNKICQDVAVMPFLWIVPLGLYLLSFVICFDSPRWYVRPPFLVALLASGYGICWAMAQGIELALWKQVGIYSGALFVCCMVCHGELYRLKPAPRHLTSFYLMIAVGGALGGLFVAVAAPLLFSDFYELHLGLVLCWALFAFVLASELKLVAVQPS
ncbi:MAG: ferrichrome ABC transporter permease, partial [Kiritimatiellaeota bacterium]|nr:ferrichrome ABC transporter permease [Kiritimatiellota bacterium]